jgi:hypothetical protein
MAFATLVPCPSYLNYVQVKCTLLKQTKVYKELWLYQRAPGIPNLIFLRILVCFNKVSSYSHHMSPRLSGYSVHVFFHLDGLRPAFVISQVALKKPCGKIQCTVLLSLTAIAHFTIT